MMQSATDATALVLAGPILRHVTAERLVLWMAAQEQANLRLRVRAGIGFPLLERRLSNEEVHVIQLGKRAFLYLIDVLLPPLPLDIAIEYDIGIEVPTPHSAAPRWIKDYAPHLCLPGKECPNYVVKSRIDRLLHGSCRRPHHTAHDGLARVDEELSAAGNAPKARPALLLMTGDQIYADDVAGPTLRAIHTLIDQLGLFDETISGSTVSDSAALRVNPDTYYHRERLLPETERNEALLERFFGGARKPIFTASNAHNHLISFAEVIAMYLLVWSPVCWRIIQVRQPDLQEKESAKYLREQGQIDRFVTELPRAARALAHLPTYMIFDDHDITDDWNLSALWESTVYEHPYSRRIVGNAMLGYLLCQGWGNNPGAFADLMPKIHALLQGPKPDGRLDSGRQDQLIDCLLKFRHWHYTLPTSPRLVVLDTRTHRWRSEVKPARPSGLLDWEALTEFQQCIMGESAVIVVSPAPMFGVKLIEAIQRVFTFLGKPLLVDAENWMAHRGAANVLLNIFGHSGTPQAFVILSGDVHYSFVYDVRLRHKAAGPKIWQITSSGIKNEFPPQLLEWLDKLNRWLYAPRSPLNWFTKRRRMHIVPRAPTGREAGERLWNNAGIGLVVLDEHGAPIEIRQLNATSGDSLFEEDKDAHYQ